MTGLLFQIPEIDIRNICSLLYWILGQWDTPKGDITFLISEFIDSMLSKTINIIEKQLNPLRGIKFIKIFVSVLHTEKKISISST